MIGDCMITLSGFLFVKVNLNKKSNLETVQ